MAELPELSRRQWLALTGWQAAAGALALPLNTAQAMDRTDPFIEQLLARMTLEEKAGQLSMYSDGTRADDDAPAASDDAAAAAQANPSVQPQTRGELLRAIAEGRVGALFNGVGVHGARQLQRQAVEQSRLKIPLVFAADVIHGLRTVFPVPLAEAAAFDPGLAERTARATAVEATASGVQWTFAPMVDLARDQRWGRVVEGAGEDVHLGRQLAAARVRGFQGPDLRRDDALLATVKHFAAYGGVTGGMEYGSVELAETTLRDQHLPPYQAGVDAGALSVMTSFNDISGVPSTANRHLLTGILRDEWGFEGLVVSDFASDEELIAHGYAADGRDAARKSLLAGCDMAMQSGLYQQHLPALVREGVVPLAALDRAVRRVLHVKKALGLFDNPYRSLDPARQDSQVRLPATVALAREAARRSVVLLKNEGGLLPLRAQGQRIALIGPFGEDRLHLMGPWSIWADHRHGVGLAQGLRAAMADATQLAVVAGCEAEAALPGGLAAAVQAAQAADVVVLALGEHREMAGEAASRADIGLPPAQLALAEAVAATGKPLVVVLRHGRALALTGAVRQAQAILAGWFLGSETGHALADLLFGAHSPCGRLPVSFPQASGQQPYFYNHRPTGRPQTNPAEGGFKARYREVANQALYPFGHGLTYGEARYGATALSAGTLAWDGAVQVSATVTNTGARAMREVAQLYIRQRVASLTRPVRELKGFLALQLQPGESATARFTLTRHDLAYVLPDLRTAAEPGVFDIVVAPSAVAGTAVALTLLPGSSTP
ncbi:glycoside hydrolase family 3 N-terminal domain-containing protein [Pseudorhodoferax sp.]|uniref:glycoside hydrolase family 3 N-terminal domain-containing protein n=1 Tax=Pseudorhodoferax sp. TaxID=1993553 RepID=UPI002DD65C9B|nr:glycoside hydrolase family 3 N-terminal domain-containing protein [Pseudorhodoferax sp.]